MKIRVSNGKYFLVGGKLAVFDPSAVALALTLTLADFVVGNPLSSAVFQRKAGTEGLSVPYANLKVTVGFTGPAPTIPQVMAEDYDTGAPLTAWTTLSSFNTLNGVGVGTWMGAPQGLNYRIKLRDGAQPNNSATSAAGTTRWGVGVTGLAIGQSNMMSLLGSGYYNDIIPGASIGEFDYANSSTGRKRSSFFSNCGFHGASNGGQGIIGDAGTTNSACNTAVGGALGFVRILAARLEAKYGYPVPVCLTPWAVGATGQEQWDPETPGGYLNRLMHGTGTDPVAHTIGCLSPDGYHPGDFEFVIEHHGEANSGVSNRVPYFNGMKTKYQNLLNFVAPYGRTAANLGFFPSVLGVYGAGVALDGVESVRGAVFDFDAYARANNWPKARMGLNCMDLDPTAPGGDQGLHFRDPYGRMGIRRLLQTVLHYLGCATYSGLGPRIASVVNNGASLTVNVAHEGGTALTTKAGSGAPTGFYLNTAADFSGANIALTAAITGANTIVLTPPGGTVLAGKFLKYLGGLVGSAQSRYPDISNLVLDNAGFVTGATGSDYMVGLPLLPTPDAIQVT